jgi:hypothetical protein
MHISLTAFVALLAVKYWLVDPAYAEFYLNKPPFVRYVHDHVRSSSVDVPAYTELK